MRHSYLSLLLFLPFLALGQPNCSLINFNHRVSLSEKGPQERRLFEVGFELVDDKEEEEANLNLDFVDIHFNFGGEMMNHRLLACAEEDAAECDGFSWFARIELDPSVFGSELNYMFTYSLGGIACETKESQQLVATLPIVSGDLPSCPLFNFSHEVLLNEKGDILKTIRFTPLTDFLDSLDFIDLHFAIDGGEMINVRLENSTSSLFEWRGDLDDTRLVLGADSVIRYFFTYSWRNVACDSEIFTHGTKSPESSETTEAGDGGVIVLDLEVSGDSPAVEDRELLQHGRRHGGGGRHHPHRRRHHPYRHHRRHHPYHHRPYYPYY